MLKKNADFSFSKQGIQFLVLFILLLMIISFWSDQLYGIFGEKNYVTMHLLIEILIIVVSLSIAIQAWLISPHILSKKHLYIGGLFFTIGLLEIAHALSYKGMPYFVEESSAYSATWFYMMARILLSAGLLAVFVMPEKAITKWHRWFVYFAALLFVVACAFLVFWPEHILAPLVVDGRGTTPLKNELQYFAMALHTVYIVIIIKKFNEAPQRIFLMLCASIYILISDIMFTTYKDVYDIKNFIGHIFQLTSFYILFRAIYYSSIEKPFQDLVETQTNLENSKQELQFMAYHDEITNLPNERYLLEELKKQIHKNQSLKAVLTVEVDRLVTIKSSLGVAYANQMLTKVGERLQTVVSNRYLISKPREDFFIIFIDELNNSNDILQLCQQLQEAMKSPFHVQHFSLTGNLNIGIAYYPDDATTVEKLLLHSQYAMQGARKVPERIQVYKSTMSSGMTEKLILEHDLHKALDNQELFLEYQPQINLQTGEITSVEALVRWLHPQKGWISPGVFIPIAEESGLIIPIGKWVLETACHQVKKWEKEGLPTLNVAVNLSLGQLFQQDLIQMVKDVLEKTELQPQYLQLEITESMTINIDHMTSVLDELKELGIKVAVDDFGTGYSSLSYLKDFSIDCLKIDRSFVQNIQADEHDKALVAMIISMAKHLRLKVVAEGIEEPEQLSFLLDDNCDMVQGYLFSKPISPKQLLENYDEIQDHARSILLKYGKIEI